MRNWLWIVFATALLAFVLHGVLRTPPEATIIEPQHVVQNRIWYSEGHWPSIPLGVGHHRTVRSLLAPSEAMGFGDFVWDDLKSGHGSVWIRVDLPRQIISVFRGKDEIGSAVILYGTDGKPTPTGTFTILEKAKDHRSNLYDAEMPFMLRLTNDGVAIHASAVLEGSATHGCIGIPAAFAERLFKVAARHDEVVIVGAKQV